MSTGLIQGGILQRNDITGIVITDNWPQHQTEPKREPVQPDQSIGVRW